MRHTVHHGRMAAVLGIIHQNRWQRGFRGWISRGFLPVFRHVPEAGLCRPLLAFFPGAAAGSPARRRQAWGSAHHGAGGALFICCEGIQLGEGRRVQHGSDGSSSSRHAASLQILTQREPTGIIRLGKFVLLLFQHDHGSPANMKCHSGRWHVALAAALVFAHVAHAGPSFPVKIASAEVSDVVRVDGFTVTPMGFGVTTAQLSMTALKQCSLLVLRGNYIAADGAVTGPFTRVFSNTVVNRKYRQEIGAPAEGSAYLSLEGSSCLPGRP